MREIKKTLRNENNMKSDVYLSDSQATEIINNNITPDSDNYIMNNTEYIIDMIDNTQFRLLGLEYQLHTLLGIRNLVSSTDYKVPATKTFDIVQLYITKKDFKDVAEFVDDMIASKLQVLLERHLKILESDQVAILEAGLPYWTTIADCIDFREDYFFEQKIAMMEERANKKRKTKNSRTRLSPVVFRRKDGLQHKIACKKLGITNSQYVAYRRKGLPMTTLADDRKFIDQTVVQKLVFTNISYGEFNDRTEFAKEIGIHISGITRWIEKGAPVDQGVDAFNAFRKEHGHIRTNYGEFRINEWAEYLDCTTYAVQKAERVQKGFFLRPVEEVEEDFKKNYKKGAGIQIDYDPFDQKITSFIDAIQNGESEDGLVFTPENDLRVA